MWSLDVLPLPKKLPYTILDEQKIKIHGNCSQTTALVISMTFITCKKHLVAVGDTLDLTVLKSFAVDRDIFIIQM